MTLPTVFRFVVATGFVVACIAVAMPASAQCSYCWDAWCTQVGENECPSGDDGYHHAAGSQPNPQISNCPGSLTGENWDSCHGEGFTRNFSHSYAAPDWCQPAHLECAAPAPEAVANAVASHHTLNLKEWIEGDVITLNKARQAIQTPDCIGRLISHIPIDRELLAELTDGT